MQETEAGRLSKTFDVEEAMAGVEGDRELLVDLIQLFNRDRDEMVRTLRGAVAGRDSKTVQAAAHRLKGALSVLAAREATELAFALERAGRTGDLTEAAGTHAAFEGALERLAAALERFQAG
jgi:HPt (histidine-containing phosphotransfer) domain-containing protein